MRKVVIEVTGGVAEVTSCPSDVKVIIIDNDNDDDNNNERDNWVYPFDGSKVKP